MTTYRNDLHRELHEILCMEAKKRGRNLDWIVVDRRDAYTRGKEQP